MIAFIGIKKNTEIYIREKLTIKSDRKDEILENFLEKFKEVVILNTCNRTEIYFSYSASNTEILKDVFEILNWDEELKEYIFYIEGEDVYKHLFEVACGYHSKIVGEDQILGQIKDAYKDSIEAGACNKELGRLFQEAITCGKKFRSEAKLYEIPVSSVSIAVSNLVKDKNESVMVIGYGAVGRLAIKYLLSHNITNIYLALRNKRKAMELEETSVKIIDFEDRREYINKVDCIISCTSAPFTVINKEDIVEEGKPLVIYDMSVPMDVHKDVALLDRIVVYNIDEISKIEDENKSLRVERMNSKKYIVDKYIKEYGAWVKLRSISPLIQELRLKGKNICEKRITTFEHKSKSKEDVDLVNMLIKSTSDTYINRAIEVLKQETLDGGEECLKIIKKIFLMEN
ncbi:MAG: glutamyl-tRNA reductase [Clostridium sp.]|nr:glutamyl-tRNA reductase [Clostridium sp.]